MQTVVASLGSLVIYTAFKPVRTRITIIVVSIEAFEFTFEVTLEVGFVVAFLISFFPEFFRKSYVYHRNLVCRRDPRHDHNCNRFFDRCVDRCVL